LEKLLSQSHYIPGINHKRGEEGEKCRRCIERKNVHDKVYLKIKDSYRKRQKLEIFPDKKFKS
jgi:hypothetical protein